MKNDNTRTPEETLTIEQLRSLKLPGMAEIFEAQTDAPNTSLYSYQELVAKMVENECNLRSNKKKERLLKKAHLRYPFADIDESVNIPARLLDPDLINRLATCAWVNEKKNLLLTGKIGSGKTHMCCALCVSAIHKLKTVLYITARDLLNKMESARVNKTENKYLNYIASLDLLAIDDFGLTMMSTDNSYDLFKDKTIAELILSRLTDMHYALRLEMNGINMRE